MQRLSRFVPLVLVLAAGPALPEAKAQEKAEKNETVIQEADKTVYNKKTVIDFSDVNVEGELTKPEGSYLKNRKKTKFRNLIELRGNFRPELKRSASAF